jgi:hypothetical protein
METSFGAKVEARRSQRFAVEQVVAVRSLDGRFEDLRGTSHDVSAGGLFFFSEVALPLGAPVEVFLMMPDSGTLFYDTFPLRGYGAVARVVRDDGRFGVAVAFEKIEVVVD